MTLATIISGWGNYPQQESQLLTPSSRASLHAAVKLEGNLIARGMGRSYGDSANASRVLRMSYCDHFLEFDEKTGKSKSNSGGGE